MATAKANEAVFEIRLEGLDLNDAQKQNVSKALQSAALAEIAKLDFREPLEIRKSGPGTLPGLIAVVKLRG